MQKTIVTNIVLLLLFTCTSSFQPEEWKGWRGLEKQAYSENKKGPAEWTSTENILWKVDINGEGHSSPVVSKDYVFVSAAHYSKGKMNVALIIATLFFLILFFLGILSVIILLKDTLKDTDISRYQLISGILSSGLYGFLIFIFFILYWMNFDENRNQPERILLNYLYSGSVILFSLFLLMTRFFRKSLIRITTSLVIIIIAGLLVVYLPLQDYYTTADFFQLWSLPLIISGLVIPVLLSVFMVFRIISERSRNYVKPDRSIKSALIITRTRTRIIITMMASFLAGMAGYFSIPAIALAKVLSRGSVSRIYEGGFNTYLYPDFAFPFFLPVLGIGYLLLFTPDCQKPLNSSRFNHYSCLIVLFCSLLFFILINYVEREPEYIRKIYCIDRVSGNIVWEKDCLTGPATCGSIKNSQATPTPLIHDNNVIAYFGSAGLVSMDFYGKINWENRNLPFESIHGVGASPVLSRYGIVILNSMSENPFLTLLDFNTGIEIWRTELVGYERPAGEYRTPLIYDLNGKEIIIEWSLVRNELVVYSSETGEALYRYNTDWPHEGESIATPVINEGIVYLFNILNAVAIDVNRLINGQPPIIWQTELEKRGPTTSSPVLGNGILFMVSDDGYAKSINSKTGEILWQQKLPGTYFSSPVITGNKVYFSNTNGITTVIQCSEQYIKLGENQLPEGIYSTLVPVDGQILVRTKSTLWQIK